MVRTTAVFGCLLAAFMPLAAAACSSSSNLVGESGGDGGAAPPPFSGGDDGGRETPPGYCPSNKCPESLITCKTSRFLCDVNPAFDEKNCGGCGVTCPEGDNGTTSFACVDAKCTMQCLTRADGRAFADCDRLAETGCETLLGSADNCSACGDACPDGVPCTDGVCGCPPPLVNCNGTCVDPNYDDANCGRCDNPCEDHDGAPPNAYYGCVAQQCDQLKCRESKPFFDYEDCNGDLKEPSSDGCEVDLQAQPNDEHCGGCGIRCTGDEHCVFHGGFQCGCPAGTRDCGSGTCVDITRDVESCGACGRACSATRDRSTAHARDVCNMGECKILCSEGYADCNDNPDDDCEVDLRSDPRHCGACNIRCDGVVGQACVDGRCVVEECGGVH